MVINTGRGTGTFFREHRRKNEPVPASDEQVNNPFECVRCGHKVGLAAMGTKHRNHCPWCLWSLHVDDVPGDRAAGCEGVMEPVAVQVERNGEWMLIHRCGTCKTLKANRIAGDDNELALMSLAVRPLAQPPFPLDSLDNWSGVK